MELSTIDFYYALKEWQQFKGARLQKIYLKEKVHVLQVYHQKLSQWVLMPANAFISAAKITFPPQPGGYCLFLRKRLQGFKISNIDLVGFDRIIQITVETKEGQLLFILELFDDINSMVVKDGKVISALQYRSYADRNIRGGQPYTPPPAKPAPWDANLNELIGKSAGKAFASDLGLGRKYSEEIVARTQLSHTHVILEGDIPNIHSVLQQLRDMPLSPIYNDTEALPFNFISKPGVWQAAESFNAAIDSIMHKQLESTENTEVVTQQKKLVNKQGKIIEAQQALLEKLELQATTSQRAGEAIYENYLELKTLLENIKTDWKKKSYKEIQDQYSSHPLIQAINPDGTIEVELP